MRELFESTIERLLADLATPEYVLGCEHGKWPEQLWAVLEESGFTLAAVPEALGGAEASWADIYVIVRAAGRFVAPLPLGEALLANWLLGQAGIEAQSGTLSFAADAKLSLDGDRVSGCVHDVPWGRHVDAVVAIANADSAVPSVVLLSRASAQGQTLQLNGAGEPRDQLSFSNAQVLASKPLPHRLSASVLQLGGAMLRSAQIAGALHALLDMTAGYASARTQFGRPIGAFQAVQQQLAVFAEQVAAANIAAEAAFAESGQQLAELSIAVAKVSTAEAASVGAGIAHSVHGAIGFTQEYSLHLFTRRLWAWRSEFGSASRWSQHIGQQVCAAGGDGYWPLLTAHASQPLSSFVGRSL
ncbi:acyl-CoA dehydrogenase family protein [Pseudomonas sp. UBA2684]|uniref:acyl-CoA dehydrogenase family protein n=1 Tax=Pseudomonas sp. UBA2684 TaxID=1947311 RepID=UPI000E8E732B|nr:acyl-CoA dehydrogenase family protein [Pseudomonas sp. UBA2684]HBX55727.1 acyl-CoA dehydrogenase [Pseudomonas sp.]|tara:strand:- start:7145 stop:8218 length:1074 start_codon:yes stop_codon:yes gene_type:complete